MFLIPVLVGLGLPSTPAVASDWDVASTYETCLLEVSNHAEISYRAENSRRMAAQLVKTSIPKCQSERTALKNTFGSGHDRRVAQLIENRVRIQLRVEIDLSQANEI
jgi:hypothetical protein